MANRRFDYKQLIDHRRGIISHEIDTSSPLEKTLKKMLDEIGYIRQILERGLLKSDD